MTNSIRGRLCGFALAVALFPGDAPAQTVVRSFQELKGVLKPGDVIIVSDKTGEEIWGKVTAVFPSSLDLVVIEKRRGGLETVITATRRTFTDVTAGAVALSDLSGAKGTQIYPASWDRVEALPPDSTIVVFLKTGERRNYRFRRAEQDDLLLVTASGRDETISKSFVERIVRKGYRDPLGNGMGYGALVGLVGGWGAYRLQGALCGPGCEEGSGEFLSAVFGAGIGALVGSVIDWIHKGSEDLFPVAVSPIASSQGKGVGIRLRF